MRVRIRVRVRARVRVGIRVQLRVKLRVLVLVRVSCLVPEGARVDAARLGRGQDAREAPRQGRVDLEQLGGVERVGLVGVRVRVRVRVRDSQVRMPVRVRVRVRVGVRQSCRPPRAGL